MIHGHLEYMALKADPKRAEIFARQQLKYCRRQLRYCRRQLRYCRRIRLKKLMDRLYPLFVLLGTVMVFGSFLVFSAL